MLSRSYIFNVERRAPKVFNAIILTPGPSLKKEGRAAVLNRN
jgi:hypothetical protein